MPQSDPNFLAEREVFCPTSSRAALPFGLECWFSR